MFLLYSVDSVLVQRYESYRNRSHHEEKFTKVFDGRKRSIRGLWKRNDPFYAQLTLFDPITGKNRVQRICLLDREGEPVGNVAQAVAVMEALRTKRRDTGLDAQKGTKRADAQRVAGRDLPP